MFSGAGRFISVFDHEESSKIFKADINSFNRILPIGYVVIYWDFISGGRIYFLLYHLQTNSGTYTAFSPNRIGYM
jgi:hypothetical protein